MVTSETKRFSAFLDRYFPERQIIYRSRGNVRFLSFGRLTQFAAATFFAGTILAGLIGAFIVALNELTTTVHDARQTVLHEENERLAVALADLRGRYDVVNKALNEKYRQLKALVDQRRQLEDSVTDLVRQIETVIAGEPQSGKTLEARLLALRQALSDHQDQAAALSVLVTERDELNLQFEKLQARARELEHSYARRGEALIALRAEIAELDGLLDDAVRDLDAANLRTDHLGLRVGGLVARLEGTDRENRDLAGDLFEAKRRLAAASVARDRLALENRSIGERLAAIERELATEPLPVGNGDAARGHGARIAAIIRDRDRNRRRAGFLLERLDALQTELTTVKNNQADLLDWVHEQTRSRVASLEETLALTGLDIASLAENMDTDFEGQGGPLQAPSVAELDEIDLELDPDLYRHNLARLEFELARYSNLETLARAMPLARPTDRGWVSSPYGRRRDPFTKRKSLHSGIDISAPRNTPVVATAPGVVRHAGWKGPYGRMVEIDHGNGFVTRYAHLNKIKVKRGATVAYRDVVGLMGSTGRSSGVHVHYEVVYRDETQDPKRFFEAGSYILRERPTDEE